MPPTKTARRRVPRRRASRGADRRRRARSSAHGRPARHARRGAFRAARRRRFSLTSSACFRASASCSSPRCSVASSASPRRSVAPPPSTPTDGADADCEDALEAMGRAYKLMLPRRSRLPDAPAPVLRGRATTRSCATACAGASPSSSISRASSPVQDAERLDDFFRHGMALNVAAALGVEDLSVGLHVGRRRAAQRPALAARPRPLDRRAHGSSIGAQRMSTSGADTGRRSAGRPQVAATSAASARWARTARARRARDPRHAVRRLQPQRSEGQLRLRIDPRAADRRHRHLRAVRHRADLPSRNASSGKRRNRLTRRGVNHLGLLDHQRSRLLGAEKTAPSTM